LRCAEVLYAYPPRIHGRGAADAGSLARPRPRHPSASRDSWINKLSEGLLVEDSETTRGVMTALRRKLEGQGDAEKQA
jgi:hypothetical protein